MVLHFLFPEEQTTESNSSGPSQKKCRRDRQMLFVAIKELTISKANGP